MSNKSLRNQPLDDKYNIVIDGKHTNIPGVDQETKRRLLWDKRVKDGTVTKHFTMPNNHDEEYF